MLSSLEINSLENVNPGIRPLFLNQKILQNAPEKKYTLQYKQMLLSE